MQRTARPRQQVPALERQKVVRGSLAISSGVAVTLRAAATPADQWSPVYNTVLRKGNEIIVSMKKKKNAWH